MKLRTSYLVLLTAFCTQVALGLQKNQAVGDGSGAAALDVIAKAPAVGAVAAEKFNGEELHGSKKAAAFKNSAASRKSTDNDDDAANRKEFKLLNKVAEKEIESGKKSGKWDSFLMSTSMIFVSEIGDKTFLIAALMAMRSPRLIVFTASASALVLMTILSGVVGHALPTLISQRITQFLAGILFIVFGYNLFKEGMEMSNEVGVNDEVAEVEEELAIHSVDAENDLESGRGQHATGSDPAFNKYVKQFKSLLGFVLSPTWVQVFVLTFLGEWGDRSQIATIALAAGSDYWSVILGGCIGHVSCTAIAVIGGMVLASKISMKQVTLGGSVTFFIFAIWYLFQAFYGDHDE